MERKNGVTGLRQFWNTTGKTPFDFKVWELPAVFQVLPSGPTAPPLESSFVMKGRVCLRVVSWACFMPAEFKENNGISPLSPFCFLPVYFSACCQGVSWGIVGLLCVPQGSPPSVKGYPSLDNSISIFCFCWDDWRNFLDVCLTS